jgi:hypothetical protein
VKLTLEKRLLLSVTLTFLILFAECETNGLYCQIHMEGNGNDDSHQH